MAERFDDATVYTVKFSRSFEMGPLTYRPLSEFEVAGSFLNKIVAQHGEDVVDRAAPKP